MLSSTDTDVAKDPTESLRRLPEILYVVQFLYVLCLSVSFTHNEICCFQQYSVVWRRNAKRFVVSRSENIVVS